MVPVGAHTVMVRGRSCACASAARGLAGGRGRLARPAELRALAWLNTNWRSVVEGAAYDREVEGRITGQAALSLEGDDR